MHTQHVTRAAALAVCLATLLALIGPATAQQPAASADASAPLALHPDNPHYFLFRGRPTVLITSAEHYGAVLNLDFDYTRYLDTLAADGLNLTRTFTGVYCEPPGAFNIEGNTLAPQRDRFITPWARTDDGKRWDLTKWNDAYFARLRDFMTQASKRGVVVELNLFCPFYKDDMYRLSPQNPANNTQGVGPRNREQVYTLDKHAGLLAVHEALVRKIVAELAGFDNLYYEVCNEPYFGGVTMDWQRRIADVITDAEKALPHRHLISMNIANGRAKVSDPHPAVSIFNFHYTSPPDAVDMNYALNKVIGENETGFKGTADTHYRMEAWQFLLNGGGLYNNLDYSFTAGHEDGTFRYHDKQPGCGSPAFRKQIGTLAKFIGGFDVVKMRPTRGFVKDPPKGLAAYALAEAGRQYAVYLFGDRPEILTLDLPAGQYRVTWTDPVTGVKTDGGTLGVTDAGTGRASMKTPEYKGEAAFAIERID
ncbi:MAG: hypothetical protein GC159_14605 [Phycisphaera sp.]|nr:hypothetical protein [Phycisphaera sp.]